MSFVYFSIFSRQMICTILIYLLFVTISVRIGFRKTNRHTHTRTHTHMYTEIQLLPCILSEEYTVAVVFLCTCACACARARACAYACACLSLWSQFWHLLSQTVNKSRLYAVHLPGENRKENKTSFETILYCETKTVNCERNLQIFQRTKHPTSSWVSVFNFGKYYVNTVGQAHTEEQMNVFAFNPNDTKSKTKSSGKCRTKCTDFSFIYEAKKMLLLKKLCL